MPRPLQTDEPLGNVISLRLTDHQIRVLDAMVEYSGVDQNRQALVRRLLKEEYKALVLSGMDPVDR